MSCLRKDNKRNRSLSFCRGEEQCKWDLVAERVAVLLNLVKLGFSWLVGIPGDSELRLRFDTEFLRSVNRCQKDGNNF
jgi:hypothetical protein